ncbi:MAG: hypothetical protein ACLT2T_11930 [Bilophila wadsworthia]
MQNVTCGDGLLLALFAVPPVLAGFQCLPGSARTAITCVLTMITSRHSPSP